MPQLRDLDPERTQVARQWRILIALRRQQLPLARLAELLGVTTRTVRRDLEILFTVGFPIRQVVLDSGVRVYALGELAVWPRNEPLPIASLEAPPAPSAVTS